ncbi:MAG: hypothetical protein WC234_01910 [Endomicrobiaceae bacterium]
MIQNIKIIFSFFCVCLFVMLFADNLVADNLSDKHVYGLFSENFNGATQEAGTVDDNIKLNIWANGDSLPIVSTTTTPASAKEGNIYYSCTVVGSTATDSYSGFCYTFITGSSTTVTRNISAFSMLEFYIRPKTGDVSAISVGITEGPISSPTDRTVTLSSLGVDNSSHAWQKCTVDLTSFSSADLTNIKNCFLVNTTKQTATFDLDSIVLKRSSIGEFNVAVKNISDNLETSSVTWSSSSFRNSWIAAEQYLELSLDILETDNWTVRIYTDNGDSSKDGLVDTTDGSNVLQMCWRVSQNTLPNANGDTLLITQSGAPNYALYDSGKSATDPSYYTWFYITDIATGDVTDYSLLWDSRGYHISVGGDFGGMSNPIYPKVYLGANCADAIGGLIYSANVRVVLSYE